MSTAEPPSVQALFEHAYYIGNYMSGILYGVAVMMYLMILQGLFAARRRNIPVKGRALGLYSTVLIMLVTIDISTNAVWGEQMWITFRNNPGGIVGFLATQTSVWYETLSSTSVVALIFLGDALLLYRLFIIYGSRYTVIILPLLAYLAGFALSIIELVIAGKPNGDFFHGKSINFGTPYYTITIAFNITMTLLIVIRLRRLGKLVASAVGKDSAKVYTGVASMLVESAAPYSLVGIMFLIPYALGHGTAVAFGQVWAKIACIAPLAIILRVVNGKAWARDMISQIETPVKFAPGSDVTHAGSYPLKGISTSTLPASDRNTKHDWNVSERSMEFSAV